MATLTTNPGTLRTEAIAGNNEKKTIISKWIDAITTEVSNGNVKTEEGLTGPTISARIYSMIGTAAYEAWQATENDNESTINTKGSRTNGNSKRFAENLISSTILKVASSKYSGLTNEGRANLEDFADGVMHNIKADKLIKKLSNRIARQVLRQYKNDGYDTPSEYTPTNALESIVDIESWTPEFNVSDNPSSGHQQYLTPQWGHVKPFGISKKDLASLSSIADTPEPFLIDTNDSYDLSAGTLTDASTGQVLQINKSLIGTHINPGFIDQANKVIEYSQGLTNTEQGNTNKATAEFWEDGGGTPFPPGTWLVIGQAMSLEEGYDLEQDAKLFQGLGASVHAAAISAWDLKLQTNYARPVRAIRELSKLGLLSDVDPNKEGSQFFAFNRDTGNIDLITGVDFETYQLPGGSYSPPFAEYTSGHSTFSSASAEFLTKFSGSEEFPWDIALELTFPFGDGEGQPVVLEYGTLREAAEAAGSSRLHGGIHFEDGNDNGLLVGQNIGATIFEYLSSFWA
jgi:hypothetical protein